MMGLDARRTPRLEELLQPLVSERLDHTPTIARCASRNKEVCLGPVRRGRSRQEATSPRDSRYPGDRSTVRGAALDLWDRLIEANPGQIVRTTLNERLTS